MVERRADFVRVLHVIPSLNPAWGGPARVCADLANAQVDAGSDVRVLIHEPDPNVERDRFETIRTPPLGRTALLRPSGPEILDAVEACEVVHLHGVWETILPIVSRAARAAGKPTVLLPHGMLNPWAMRRGLLKKRAALALGFGATIRNAAALQGTNEYEAESLHAWGSRVELIPSGVADTDPTRGGDGPTFRAQHGIPDDAPLALFLSRLDPVKGLTLIVEAFTASAPNGSHLAVVGPDFGAREPLEEQIASLKVADRVHLIGPAYGDDKASALAAADVFVLASEHESFGVAIAEAMSAGLPAVITDTCHFPLVAESEAGLVTAREPGAFGEALATLLSDRERAVAMGENGRSLVRERFTWPRVAEQTLTLYRDLLAGGSAPSTAAS